MRKVLQNSFAQDIVKVDDPFVFMFIDHQQLGDVIIAHKAQCVNNQGVRRNGSGVLGHDVAGG